ncbi:Vesicle-associated membrane protein 7 like protein [Argiope bruennichi]|uniref:Vesicle-associated membrane protein 7 n=1 Tax=Argiope bruennichi TaxID=94029 RepID=A0A8T0FGR0_ARGBR|nr:Vesicle-associated membrane protein 7 like protein [Argiope bruennichi]
MPILYSVVAHGSTVLAKYARCAGNFSEVTEQILAKISPEQPKLTYSHGSYLFHYILEDEIIYLCITDDGEIDELTEIMVQNIDSVANRGERLELLVDKTENLNSASVTFRKTSKNLARSMCIKNVKITVIIVLVMLIGK